MKKFFLVFILSFLFCNVAKANSVPFYSNYIKTGPLQMVSPYSTQVYYADVYCPFVPTCNSNYCNFSEIIATSPHNTAATSTYDITASVVQATTSSSTIICSPSTVQIGTSSPNLLTNQDSLPPIYFDNCYLTASTTYWMKFSTTKRYSGYSIAIQGSNMQVTPSSQKCGIFVNEKGLYPTAGWEQGSYYFSGHLLYNTISTTTQIVNNYFSASSSASSSMTTSTSTPSNNTDIGVIASYQDGTYTYYQMPFLLFIFIWIVICFSVMVGILYIKIKK